MCSSSSMGTPSCFCEDRLDPDENQVQNRIRWDIVAMLAKAETALERALMRRRTRQRCTLISASYLQQALGQHWLGLLMVFWKLSCVVA
jgi:hypothetical protein